MPDTPADRDALVERVRGYWNVRIHDLEITRHPVGSPGFFADLDTYHFDKLHHLLRLVDFDGYHWYVHVFDAATGRALQRRPVPDRGRAVALAEHRGQVFLLYRERGLQGQAGLAALHPVDGSLLWSSLLPAGAMDPPGASYQVLAHEDRLLLFSTQPVEAWILDPTSGRVENRLTLDTSLGAERKLDPVLLPGGRVLVGAVTRQQGQGFQYRYAYALFLLDPAAEGEAAIVWEYRSRDDEESRSLRHLTVAGDSGKRIACSSAFLSAWSLDQTYYRIREQRFSAEQYQFRSISCI